MEKVKHLEVLSWPKLEFRFSTPQAELESSEESTDEPESKTENQSKNRSAGEQKNQSKTGTAGEKDTGNQSKIGTSCENDTENKSTAAPITIQSSDSEESSSENQPRWHDRLDGPESGTDSGEEAQTQPAQPAKTTAPGDDCIVLSD